MPTVFSIVAMMEISSAVPTLGEDSKLTTKPFPTPQLSATTPFPVSVSLAARLSSVVAAVVLDAEARSKTQSEENEENEERMFTLTFTMDRLQEGRKG